VRWTDPSGQTPVPTGKVTQLEGVYIGAVIAMTFMAGKPGDRWAEYPVPGASSGRKRNVLSVNGFADLVDFDAGEVYEVKSRRDHNNNPADAVIQLNRYIDGLNAAARRGTNNPYYRPARATGQWVAGTTFLAGGAQSFGLWPFGIDPAYDPKRDGYYEIKAKQSSDAGILIYWGEKISDRRARQLTPRYMPDTVKRFIEVIYKDPYGRDPRTRKPTPDWRQPDWQGRPPQLYPGMNVFDPGYWCGTLPDILLKAYEDVGRFGNQLDPGNSGTVPPIMEPGRMPLPVIP
jgi:hypothetical protein